MNNGNNRNNFIEKEVELNIKGENEGEIVDENIRHNSLDSNSKNNLVFNNQNNIEDINSLEYLNLDLVKSQSEEINHKDVFNFHDIGIKLFPGAFRYNKKKNYEQNIFDGNRPSTTSRSVYRARTSPVVWTKNGSNSWLTQWSE